LIIAEENNEVKKQNKKDDPKSNDEENIFDHNDQTADYKKTTLMSRLWTVSSIFEATS